MTEISIGDQTVRYDRDATVAIYGSLVRGGAEDCGCLDCLNFAAQRDVAYPAPFRELLSQLGLIPLKKEKRFPTDRLTVNSTAMVGGFTSSEN